MKNKEIVIIIGIILLILVGGFGTSNMEQFKLLSDKRRNAKRIGTNMMASECQNKCAKMPNCKYIQRPRYLELWDKGDCYMTDDDYQYKVGSIDSGSMRTWRNKNYVKPSHQNMFIHQNMVEVFEIIDLEIGIKRNNIVSNKRIIKAGNYHCVIVIK